MSDEEIKANLSNTCVRCQQEMSLANLSFPIELECGHNLCLQCVAKEISDEKTEIKCDHCESL